MTLEVAQKSIDWIFSNVPDYADSVHIDFIGGEPLLEFSLIKEVVSFVCEKQPDIPYIFFATTNGTVLDDDMKAWFVAHRSCFWLALSLDGNRATHNRNRCNSFDTIDIDFFLRNWPNQGVKMTLSEYSLQHLAEDVKYLHSLGINIIDGVNLFEGDFDWDKDEYITMLIPQLLELTEYYVENDTLQPCQLFNTELNSCESQIKEHKKWCGIGTGTPFFDVDGRSYPCSFVTPMTFTHNELKQILKTDFSNDKNFIDDECFNDCYIYSICPYCAGVNYMVNKMFRKRDKRKCRIQKLISLFIADMEAKRIVKNPKRYDDTKLYYTIEAIKKIKSLYLEEFKRFAIIKQ